MRDDEESSEEPLCDLLGHGMIGVHLKERLAPVPDWLYPCILTVRTVQHAEWEVDQYLAIAFCQTKKEFGRQSEESFLAPMDASRVCGGAPYPFRRLEDSLV